MFNENDLIEEAHFLENRALIKIANKNFWYKIALNYIGKHENEIEAKFYNNNPENFISKIIDIKDNNMILIQEYVPLESNYFKIKDLNFLYNNETEIDILKKLLKKQEKLLSAQIKENIVLKKHLHTLTSAFNHLVSGRFAGIESPFKEEYEMLIKKEEAFKIFQNNLINYHNFEKKELKKRDFGFNYDKFWLVNFSHLIKDKNKYIS